ncbi:MAG: helix-turn-helix transcriptional regulator [Bacilli bacterium]|nr:helix-turn-helix transcriptional regulator [Bacilli bacterium]
MGNVRFKDYLIDYLEFNNITNKDFANRIGISEKHLIDILAGERNLSSDIIEKISIVTDIPQKYIYSIELNYKLEKKIFEYLEQEKIQITSYLQKFKYTELIKECYIDFTDKSDKIEIVKDILKFLRVPEPQKVYEIEKGSVLFKSKNDKTELLLLWLEKCYRKTLEQNVENYNKENIKKIVDFILECAKKEEFIEEKLIAEFNKNGINLVIQDDIVGSKIRGAFKVHRGIPAIYITHKHKRIADIYFALLHELAHCKSDFNKAQGSSLVSFMDENLDECEEKADKQAYSWMVDEEYYQTICCSDEYNIYLEDKYPKAFVVYRLAKDKKIKYGSDEYQQFNISI